MSRYALRRNGGYDVLLYDGELHPKVFSGDEAERIVRSGAPYQRVESLGLGARSTGVLVPDWIGDLWLDLGHGEDETVLRALARDPELCAAAAAVTSLVPVQSYREAVLALLEAAGVTLG